MRMPDPDIAILDRKAEIVTRLQAVLPDEAVVSDPTELRVYECDALTAYRCPPLAVVLPGSTEEVSAVLAICSELGVPVVPRGSGTSLAGGALPTADSVILGVARLNAVLEADYDNRFIRVQTRPHQPERHRRGGGRGFLLRARPVEPARLRHRRQHRDEFGRRALPEIRRDDQQPAGRDDGADGRHRGRDRRRASGCAGL